MPIEITTTNNAFRLPTAANDGTDFATGLNDFATDVDKMWQRGTLVLRPAASVPGRYYLATDDTSSGSSIGTLYFDTGSAWVSGFNPPSRGATNIATSESRTNTAYGTLATPDQVTGIVLPTNGLIAVWYQATWSESVQGAAQAVIFVGANQLKFANPSVTNPIADPASIGSPTVAGTAQPLSTSPIGLASSAGGSAGTAYAGDATTGQVVGGGAQGVGGGNAFELGGPCYVFAAAGTYTISVQFKASSGSVTALNRRLWVQALSFS